MPALAAGLLGITAGPLNTLHRRDPQSGVGLWTLQLDSPAVALHWGHGAGLKLHGSAPASQNASTVVVGTLHGTMYVLPLAANWLPSGLPHAPTPNAFGYDTPDSPDASYDTYLSSDTPIQPAASRLGDTGTPH